jgi:23S rRNA (cytidine1920-2'-O)/16S rRNA (cytidine1409-2'-O)-methyltransferase
MERTNARSLTPSSFPDPPEFAAADASFISLKLLLPVINRILSPGGSAVVLVKPQFEVGKGNVGKGGVVRSKENHAAVLTDILHFCSGLSGLTPAGLTFSPIRGPMGNIEFLLYLSGSGGSFVLPSPEKTAEEAHLFFRKEG